MRSASRCLPPTSCQRIPPPQRPPWIAGRRSPSPLRARRLAELEAAAREFTLAALERLDIDDGTRVHATACALEPVWAEIQYAEAAPDPASRLALLRLDRERMTRFQKARAQVDRNERAQAMAELDAWYQASLESLFPSDAVP